MSDHTEPKDVTPMTDRATPKKDAGCPLGGPRCPEAICDCFVDLYPDDPLGLHPEAFIVGSTNPLAHVEEVARVFPPGVDRS